MPPKQIHQLTVTRITDETTDACSFGLGVQEGGESVMSYMAGQFLTLKVPNGEGYVARCYSLTTSPGADEGLAITVKRMPHGIASNWLCDNLQVGDVIEVKPPSGTFVCRDYDRELLFFAAGSGITPVYSIIKDALRKGSAHIWLFYANRDEGSIIFRSQLRELQVRYAGRFGVIHWLESVQGLPTRAAVALLARQWPSAEVFICGPEPFMALVSDELTSLGTARRMVHRENYLSLSSDPFAETRASIRTMDTAATVEVTFEGKTSSVAWGKDSYLLDALLDSGLDVPYSCREGRCSACACRLVAGQVRMDANHILNDSDLERGLVLACQSRIVSKHIEITYEGV